MLNIDQFGLEEPVLIQTPSKLQVKAYSLVVSERHHKYDLTHFIMSQLKLIGKELVDFAFT